MIPDSFVCVAKRLVSSSSLTCSIESNYHVFVWLLILILTLREGDCLKEVSTRQRHYFEFNLNVKMGRLAESEPTLSSACCAGPNPYCPIGLCEVVEIT